MTAALQIAKNVVINANLVKLKKIFVKCVPRGIEILIIIVTVKQDIMKILIIIENVNNVLISVKNVKIKPINAQNVLIF